MPLSVLGLHECLPAATALALWNIQEGTLFALVSVAGDTEQVLTCCAGADFCWTLYNKLYFIPKHLMLFRTRPQGNVLQEGVIQAQSLETHACSVQHCSPSPGPQPRVTAGCLEYSEAAPDPSGQTALLPQVISEVALVATDEPTQTHEFKSLPDGSADYAATSAPPLDAGSRDKAPARLSPAADYHKFSSELRSLCTALLAIPDKLASVCCACPAALRPRNLIPQLFTSVIRTSRGTVQLGGTTADGECQEAPHTHVLVALAALVTSATLRGHAAVVARWMHQQHAHARAWAHTCVSVTATASTIVKQQGGSSDVSSLARPPHASDTCVCVSHALLHVSEPSVHERLWHSLLEASVQSLETRKASSRGLVDMRVSTGVCAAMWHKGTSLVLPHAQQVSFWVKLLTVRGARLPPAALLHSVLVR